MYADDTLLIESGKTQESSIEACQEAMNEVHTGCILNRLTINIDKIKTRGTCVLRGRYHSSV